MRRKEKGSGDYLVGSHVELGTKKRGKRRKIGLKVRIK